MKNVIIISESLCHVPNEIGTFRLHYSYPSHNTFVQSFGQIHVSWSISEQQR